MKKKIDSFKQAETVHGLNRLTWAFASGGWDFFCHQKKWWGLVVWFMEDVSPKMTLKMNSGLGIVGMICPDDEFVVCEVCDQLKQGPCL